MGVRKQGVNMGRGLKELNPATLRPLAIDTASFAKDVLIDADTALAPTLQTAGR